MYKKKFYIFYELVYFLENEEKLDLLRIIHQLVRMKYENEKIDFLLTSQFLI